VLTITQILRRRGVVDKFVEFFGAGLDSMSVADRATIANMAPEYGATCGYFPVDDETLRYLRLTGRPEDVIERVEAYCRAQYLFRDDSTPNPDFTDIVELDLDSVVPSLAGPKRPQDRVPLSGMREAFQFSLVAPAREQGCGVDPSALNVEATFGTNGGSIKIKHGVVAIAAITSCTNTSNPSVMVAAGLLAKKALEKGLTVPPYVKTSLAPGSRVVTEYLKKADLIEPLAQLGFNLVAYGCTTCIGNSGPLPTEMAKAIASKDLVAAAVLSGNRNFDGRINPLVKASYLASPPLVVAFALAGKVDINLDKEPLGVGTDGQPVYLQDLWPSQLEIAQAVSRNLSPTMFQDRYAVVFEGSDLWKGIQASGTDLYEWDPLSTYIHHPPFFQTLTRARPSIGEIKGARILCIFGDSISTDHISPAGNIAVDSPAGKYLQERGIKPKDFNSYGSRRGNDLVMERGTFANIRIRNLMVAPREGGWTKYFGKESEDLTIFDAAQKYKEDGVPTIVLAGRDYGQGSSRDWAAKGASMLGVKAVIAISFERIHRSNLVGMGVLPLRFEDGQDAASLGLDGSEVLEIEGLTDQMAPQAVLTVRARRGRAKPIEFRAKALLNTETEVNYYRNGGILQTVLRDLVG
jgi:aconitate hydratase